MSTTGKALKAYAILALCILCSAGLRVLFLDEYSVDIVSTFFLLMISVLFCVYINWSIVQGRIKSNLLICGGMIVAILIIRGARYGAFWGFDQLMRYLWYIYYIPLLFIPYFSLRAALAVGVPEQKKTSGMIWLSGAVSFAFMGLVLTNDFHQLVFRLHEGFAEHWRDEYSYGVAYYFVTAWICLLLLSSVGMLIYKCRVLAFRSYIWVPLIPMAFGTLWLILVATGKAPTVGGVAPVEFPETFCFTVGGTWFCCMQIGLAPVNQAYKKLFQISSIDAVIADKDVVVKADSKDFIVRKEAIRGGYVYWKADVREINRINEKLEAVSLQLKEEAEFLRLENELKEKNIAIDIKNKLYDAIAVKVLVQSQKISELSARATERDAIKTQNMYQICILGSYIKRMANLMILANQCEKINGMELALALSESLRYLEKANIKTNLHTVYDNLSEYPMYPAERMIFIYEAFEGYVEKFLEGLRGVSVTLQKDVCKLVFEGDLSEAGESDREEGNSVQHFPEGIREEYDEDTLFVSIPLWAKEDT